MEFDVVIVEPGPPGCECGHPTEAALRHGGRQRAVGRRRREAPQSAPTSSRGYRPKGLNRLFPDWKEKGAPVGRRACLMTGSISSATKAPAHACAADEQSRQLHRQSAPCACSWLAEQAVESSASRSIPGFAATDDENNAVVGIATGDMGVGLYGEPTHSFVRGMELRGKYTLIAEGARGSLSKQLIEEFQLSDGREPQKYGIGLKELWRVAPDKHKPGLVQHSFGWPLDARTGGGSFLYHYGDNLVSVGFVLHLNYEIRISRRTTNSSVSRRIRPYARPSRAECSGHVPRDHRGGRQLDPAAGLSGGALLGCAAGFMNVPRIKGSHNAMLSGIFSAEAAFAALADGRAHDKLAAYEDAVRAATSPPT